jgi:hypothetical protein
LRVCCTPLPILRFVALQAVSSLLSGRSSYPSATRAPFEAFPSPEAVSHLDPSREILPSCRHPSPPQVRRPLHRPIESRVLRLGVLSWMLAQTPSDFRALSRWSNPPSHSGVSTSTCALLPWVSASVRRPDSSQQGFSLVSEDASRRSRPPGPLLCVSS